VGRFLSASVLGHHQQESQARGLDPYQVAGLIRQETVFNPRAVSPARAYGLMQLIVPTAVTTARRIGTDRAITMESLFEPRLNIQLGTAYFKDQLDKYGRIEYVAAAYNAGPNRVVQWRASLPLQMDEWQEEVPFRKLVCTSRASSATRFSTNGFMTRMETFVPKSARVRSIPLRPLHRRRTIQSKSGA
jgi:hypothetical protein